MMKIFAALALVSTSLTCASVALADEDPSPPCTSVTDSQVKPPICSWVCSSYDSNGGCVYTYECN